MTLGSDRPAVLLLVHRIPYPPDKGDKIRSFHILKALAERFRVRLGCFVDDPADLSHLPAVSAMVERICAIPIANRWRKLSSLAAIGGRHSLSARFYRHPKMQAFVDEMLADSHRVLVFSSPMAQYLPCAGPWAPGGHGAADCAAGDADDRRRPMGWLADFVDVDSVKWAQYAQRQWPPMSWLYRLESVRLARDEARWAVRADRVTFVSDAEAALFRARLKVADVKGPTPEVLTLANGVAADHFDPTLAYPCPFAHPGPRVVFVGAMDYWANVDAVTGFVQSVWPKVRARIPDAQFFIVGRHPTSAVLRLAGRHVKVTGGVDDVREWLACADVVVAPLQIARGVQNKVLEAMAMARPIVASPEALEGIPLDETLRASMMAAGAESQAEQIIAWLQRPRPQHCPEYREFVLQNMSWTASMRQLISLLEADPAGCL